MDTFEDCLHVLRECHFAKLIWNIFIPTEHQTSTPWHSRIGYVAMLLVKILSLVLIASGVRPIAWNIWVWRCRAVFDGDFLLPHDPNRRIANDVEIAVSAFYSKKTEPSMKVTKFLAWEFPSVQIKKK